MISKTSYEISRSNLEEYGLGYASDFGAFFIWDGPGNRIDSDADTCREEFSHQFTADQKCVGFKCEQRAATLAGRVSRFFDTATRRLAAKGIDAGAVEVHRTDQPGVIICEAPAFWRKNLTNRQLFTLLLRAGAVYYGAGRRNSPGFDRILSRKSPYDLARKTAPAVCHFLRGNVMPTYKALALRDENEGTGGWVQHFGGQDEEFVRKNLVSPAEAEKRKEEKAARIAAKKAEKGKPKISAES